MCVICLIDVCVILITGYNDLFNVSLYEAPFYYLFDISLYQEFDFLLSRNNTHFLVSKNRIPDIKKSIS